PHPCPLAGSRRFRSLLPRVQGRGRNPSAPSTDLLHQNVSPISFPAPPLTPYTSAAALGHFLVRFKRLLWIFSSFSVSPSSTTPPTSTSRPACRPTCGSAASSTQSTT